MSATILLVGPPASGKDTITAALEQIDDRYVYFEKLKVGSGRTNGYRMTESAALDAMLSRGEIALLTSRYSSRYAVDYREITRLTEAGRTPVIHIGRIHDLLELRSNIRSQHMLTVLLKLPRDVAIERICARGTGDEKSRIAAYDEDVAQARAIGESPDIFEVVIDTAQTDAATAAQFIHHRVLLTDCKPDG